MTWVRLDDQFSIHRKVAALSSDAYRLHVDALCWSARNLADGYIGTDDLRLISPAIRTPARFAAELVRREVWHFGADSCSAPKCPEPVDNGWRIHEYFVYQFSKEQVTRQRAATRGRVSRWRDAHSNGVTNGVGNAAPGPSRSPNGSVVTELTAAGPFAVDKPSRVNGSGSAATRQPPPFAEAVDAALNPDRAPWDAFTKEAP